MFISHCLIKTMLNFDMITRYLMELPSSVIHLQRPKSSAFLLIYFLKFSLVAVLTNIPSFA